VVAAQLAGELEAGLPVGTPCLDQDVGGGQDEVVAPGLAGEGDALSDKAAAYPASACVRLQQEQPQRCGPSTVAGAQDGSDRSAAQFSDPGTLGLRVIGTQIGSRRRLRLRHLARARVRQGAAGSRMTTGICLLVLCSYSAKPG
jgi:hypothetical protein